VETSTVPKTRITACLSRCRVMKRALGQRVIEVPENARPAKHFAIPFRFIAYVPVGSIKRARCS
jgi:hypothetical protein